MERWPPDATVKMWKRDEMLVLPAGVVVPSDLRWGGARTFRLDSAAFGDIMEAEWVVCRYGEYLEGGHFANTSLHMERCWRNGMTEIGLISQWGGGDMAGFPRNREHEREGRQGRSTVRMAGDPYPQRRIAQLFLYLAISLYTRGGEPIDKLTPGS